MASSGAHDAWTIDNWGDEIYFDAPFHSEKEGNG